MLKRACIITWIVCLSSLVHADIPLSQMSRLSNVTLEQDKTELVFTIRLFPNRGIDKPKIWAVNNNSIVLVKFPRTYVDPQVKDFRLANEWIESVSAHQFDKETVNLRIALKNGFSMDANLVKSEVVGDNVILHMPMPIRTGSMSRPSSEIASPVADDIAQINKASEKIEAKVEMSSQSESFEMEISDKKNEQKGENQGLMLENVELTKEELVDAETTSKLPLLDSGARDSSIPVQNNELFNKSGEKSFNITRIVTVSVGLCGLLLVAFGAFRKIRKSEFGSSQPRVITRCPLGFKKYLAVVEFEGIRYLIAVGPHDTALLAKLNDSGESQKFETVLINQTRSNAELSTLEQIKNKLAMLKPLGKQ